MDDNKENNVSAWEKKRTAFPGLCIPDEMTEETKVSVTCELCNFL